MQANAPTVTIAAALADAARRIDAFDARELLRHLLQKEHAWLIAHDREPLHPDHWAAFQALVTRRASGEPLAYVTGQRGFWSLDLTVTPDTLIPRAETELLVKLALQHLTLHPDIALVITDLRMPEESGMSLIKRLREHTSRQHLPVIVMSGHAGMEDVSDMLRLQVLDLFRKPIYHVRLLETLNNLFPLPRLQLVYP